MEENKKEKKRGFLFVLFKLILEVMYPRELLRINKSLIKAHEITNNPYMLSQAWKNRMWMLIIVSPLIVLYFLVKIIIKSDEFIRPWLSSNFELILRSIKSRSFNADMLIHPSEETIMYLAFSLGLSAFFLTLAPLMAIIVRKTNPLIKDTLLLEKNLMEFGISDKDHKRLDYVVATPAGILARMEMPSAEILKEKKFWSKLKRIPSDVQEDEYDNTIKFIGNGFTLKSAYTYKL